MSLPPVPPNTDVNASRVNDIYAGLVTTWVLAVIVTASRFFTLRLNRNRVHLDDWLALASMVGATAEIFTGICYLIPKGVGRHIWVLPEDAPVAFGKGLFVLEVAYTWTLTTVKYSSLSFYWRIFSARQSIHAPIWILTGMVTAWGVAIFLLTFLQCAPLSLFWQRFDVVDPPAATCAVETHPYVLGVSIPNIITDALIVILPLPYVWTLQLRTSQRLALGGIFLLGFFVTTVSGIRLSYLIHPSTEDADMTWIFSDAIMWSGIEVNLTIVGCCLPSLKSLLNLVIHGRRSLTSSGRRGYGMSRSGARKPNPNASNARVDSADDDDELTFYGVTNVHISGAKSRGAAAADDHATFARLSDTDSLRSRDDGGSTVELTAIPKNAITITRDIRVHSTRLKFGDDMK